ncbi:MULTISPECIES: helix-turn-helix domain-containing protein [unclassified Brevundimonas]|uniref:helix-turn-helix domain-containing protein n=1 Tax=unclassified Brevundimonas TaxID=2622653 RepID=UPI0006F37CAF|nr:MULTISPECIES: helix-turn-helix domain-containing protein [unclassified Brevundimonas]KQY66784.1 hypothetical protein ASD25_14710 [Brevundimonas sp. Root1423]KRA22812.1 hypothetical protein ASD59_09280 [Brevundimonas sp. Root608]
MALGNKSSGPPPAAGWSISAKDVPSALDFYLNGISDWYGVSEIDHGQAFFTDNIVYQFGPYVLGRGRSVGQVLVRGPGEIRRSGLDSVALMLDLAGMKGDADGVDINTPAGSFHLRDLARPSALKVGAVDAVVLAMPRDVAPRWLVDRNFHGLTIDGTSRLSRLLTGQLIALLESAPSLTVEDGLASIEAALVLAGRAFTDTGRLSTDQTAAVYRGLRSSAVALIDRAVHDPHFTIGSLTHALGVSRATLFRAFALSGGVQLYIKHRRLEFAREALLARVGRRPTIGEIAHAHGFVSESHFSRSFRDHYGQAPGAVQSPGPSARPASDQAGIRYDLVLGWMSGSDGPRGRAENALAIEDDLSSD